MTTDPQVMNTTDNDIAIVGMAARLPGAPDIQAFWSNLRDGVSSIRRLSEQELLEAGEDPGLIRHKNYVPFAAPLPDYEMFDADFFGLSAKDAAVMDPQHRQFLETAWEALENAGHTPENFDGPIGVFAGCGMGSYFYFNVCSNPDLVDQTGMFLLRHTGNDKDFLTTRLSHILDLKGPSISLQTACSTSLVAVHYAAQALLTGECDMALAGGVTIELPQMRGYLYKENEILSPDGQCHAFDHRAKGTVFGSGSGVVVLRRLADALRDGDHIWAVIKGTAVNNDGAQKAGYLAPSVDGQARAVAEALMVAETPAETIDYVECHGTGTYLGDPIEVAALTQAYQETTQARGFCRIGSVKTNIGHLDTAAGVAGVIKTSMALHHRQMPPSLGYEAPNPSIEFETSPFLVNDRLTDWAGQNRPRRAAVNALGVGGTNAHAILQEAPSRTAAEPSDWPFQILTLSARNTAALDAASARLADHLSAADPESLADVAWTLKTGRRAFDRRRIVVAASPSEAARLLRDQTPRRVMTHTALKDPDVVFMFPGGGAQYAGMARDLYETEPVFADWMDRGLAVLGTLLDEDIRTLWLPEPGQEDEADLRLQRPSAQLPLIMITEYALAQLWISWGVEPVALTGHSMGENTAACLAGVMSFEDCIGLVHLRGKLFDTVPAGGMLSVALPADELQAIMGPDLDLGAINAAGLSVASGPQQALDKLQKRLESEGVQVQRIGIDIAAHSRMLEPILEKFRAHLKTIPLSPPRIPLTSNRTGEIMTDAQATSPDYWVDHLRGTVLFAQGLATLAEDNRVFLEVGPGKALSSLARQHDAIPAQQVLSSLRHPEDAVSDDRFFLETLGSLWALGVVFDWEQIWGEARRVKVPLPTYPFQHAPYFITPGKSTADAAPSYLMREPDLAKWGWKPVWRPRSALVEVDVTNALSEADPETWLIFVDDTGLGQSCANRLREAGHTVAEVRPGDTFSRLAPHKYIIAPERGREGYDLLLRDLAANGNMPTRIAHFWLTTDDEGHRPGSSFYHRIQEQGFYSLMFLGQALADETLPDSLHITVVTNGAAQMRDEPLTYPAKATIAGPAGVIPRELPGITVTTLDVQLPEVIKTRLIRNRAAETAALAARTALEDRILEDMLAEPQNACAVLRKGRRFERGFRPASLPTTESPVVKAGETCLITGGFGGIGLTLAQDLAKQGANLVLLARSPMPERDDWDDHLRRHAPQDTISRRIRAVQSLEEAGATVMVAQADVCNLTQMTEVVQQATDRFGAISGVIHGAGVIDDGPLQAKSSAVVEEVFTPKIHGTQVLDSLFPDGSLKWMALFASTSTVTTPTGQIDYVAANEYLNAFAKSRAGGKTRVVAINWGIWSEVGMAAEALTAATPEAPAPVTDPGVPMLDGASFDSDGNRLFTATYSTDDWFIDEHRTARGDALLPGTGNLTLAAHALRAHGEGTVFELRDLTFLRPLRVTNGGSRDIRLRLKRQPMGYSLDILADCTLNGRRGHTLMTQASVALVPLVRPDPLDLGAIRARCGRAQKAGGGKLTAAQEVQLRFGPRWKTLDTRAIGTGEGIADLSLPVQAQDDQDYLLHPALLDIATGWAMDLIDGYQPNHLWVPVSYARVRVHAPLPDRIVSWVRNAAENKASHQTASFHVTLCAPDGTVCVELDGFTIRKLESPDLLSVAPRLTLAEVEFEQTDTSLTAAQPASPNEERLHHNLSQGIRPQDGPEAFSRALASGLPQVVVSSLDLTALTAQAAASGQDAVAAQSFERPQLEGDYVAPKNDIEHTLAGFWEELLGVKNVGVEDCFFDLGGHSLIAVRLFAKVKKAYRIEFPISILFEAPTIRKCAALIADRIGVTQTDGPKTQTQRPEQRFKNLVAMHEGEGGPRTPFFLVAGMFGNVLNLRHLANLLGTDRPFYGLQARGLYGDEAPHKTLQEAAADYISEIKMVQPKGPYLIGGFSGGGITAYEMAHQLEAMGDEVALVVLLDTPLPQRRPLKRIDRLVIQLRELQRAGPLYPLKWARNRLRWELQKRRAPAAPIEAEHQFHNTEIEAAFLGAVANYRVKPWTGRLVLFRPPLIGHWTVTGGALVNNERAYLLHDNDWGQHVPGVEVHEVPGDHDSMVLEPNVRVLASLMKQSIVNAEADAKGQGQIVSFRNRHAAE